MNRNTILKGFFLLLAVMISTAPIEATKHEEEPQLHSGKRDAAHSQAWLEREVRHELVTLPYYSVFDNLAFRIGNNVDQVELIGQVSQPTLRSDAERVVKDIDGVQSVINHKEKGPIEVQGTYAEP